MMMMLLCRKRNVESGLELLTLYQNGHSAEVSWLDGMGSRVSAQPPAPHSLQDAQQLVDETMVTKKYTHLPFLTISAQ